MSRITMQKNILIGLVVFLMLIGGLFWKKNFLHKNQPTQETTTTKNATTPLPPPQIVNKRSENKCVEPPQSQWLSYKNKELGFQLKYPPFVCDDFGKRNVSAKFDKTDGDFYLNAEYEFPIFYISIYPASSNNVMKESLDEWAKELHIKPDQIIDLSTLNLNGVEMRRIIFKYPGNTMEAKFFVKISQYIFESSVTGENTSSPDFFKNYLTWRILLTIAPYQ